MKRLLVLFCAVCCVCSVVSAKPAAKKSAKRKAAASAVAAGPQKPRGCISRAPYIGAIAIDADSGKTLFENHADVPGYPASTLKLMTLLVVTDRIESGKVKTNDMCTVSVRAAKTGGSQVYLDPKETFTVEDLLYALMIQSANDAAVALAEHVAGSMEEFVGLMNERAASIGMKNTRFQSAHGLPPNLREGQKNDISTPRDMALLCQELSRHPSIFQYTSQAYRQFRAGTPKPFDMRTHNPFLKDKTPGCDGFKTGYTATAGWSIAVTAKRKERRVIVIVMGSETRKMRDAKAREILNKAFLAE